METYCITSNKNIGNKSISVIRTKQNRLLLLSNCAVCGKIQNFRFIRNQEASRLELH